jgi:hypothetical protein
VGSKQPVEAEKADDVRGSAAITLRTNGSARLAESAAAEAAPDHFL